MIRFGFDSETFKIRPGRQAPRVVCVQSRHLGTDRVELREPGLDRLETALQDPEILIFGHGVAFDVVASIATRPRLLPLWFEAYDADRVTCTYEREKLLRIAHGSLPRYKRNGLADCLARYKIPNPFRAEDKDATSESAWRTRYAELDGVPVEQWPADALRYALADLVVDDLYVAQDTAPAAWLVDQFRQARAALWLRLTSCHGMRVDPRAVEVFGARVEAEHRYVRELLTLGSEDALDRFIAEWNAQHPDAREPMTRAWLRAPYVGDLAPEGEEPPPAMVRSIGSKDTKAAKARMVAVSQSMGLPVPLTDTGKEKVRPTDGSAPITHEQAVAAGYVATDADSTTATGDPILIAYSRFVSVGTLRSRVDRLRAAAATGIPIQPSYDTLKETGRTSCRAGDSKPGQELLAYGDQAQNPHRAPGLRECYTARDECVLISSDWKAAELNGLAQCCLDLGLDSNLARVINAGQDPHLWYACKMAGWTYEHGAAMLAGLVGDTPAERTYNKKRAKAARQGAKACNFGFPGGLGVEKFRLYAAKTYQVFFTPEEAAQRKAIWLDAFPEMVGYFAHINDLCARGAPLIHFMSGRYRGDVRYTSAANSYFQGRIADMAKHAGWNLARAIYLGPLRDRARIWAFCHDEFLVECREEDAHDVAGEVVRIMEDSGRVWCPGVPVQAEPAVSRSWRKGAEPYYGPDGRLAPWEDRPVGDDTVEKIRKALASGDSPLYTSWVHGLTEARTLEIAA